MPAGFEANAKPMRDLQEATTAAEVKAVAHRFLKPEAKAPVLFDNVRLFDADKGVFVENQAVLAGDGKIKAIVAGRIDDAAAERSRHRRQGQDVGSGHLGQPHAHRRRLGCAGQHGQRHDQLPQPGHDDRARPVGDQAPRSRATC